MTQEANLKAAVAGLAHALRDWWPGAALHFDHPEILAAAERLAAGQEPAQGATIKALRSIFGGLNGWKSEPRYLPLAPLSLDPKTLRPGPLDRIAGSQDDLKQYFQDGLAALGRWDGTQAWLENALDLAQRYLWCAPAPQYGAESDVSLYDHGRMTAALAVCLANGGQPDGEVGLLVGGDLSGVQEWLYTLSSSGAAKSLRGRSFYLQLLTEVIAYKLLDDLGLPLTNLIYAGGGNFYLLAPVGAEGELARLRAEIGRALLTAHAGDLYLALAHTTIRAADLAVGQISEAWGRITPLLGQQKGRRYADLGLETLAKEIGRPLSQGGRPEMACGVCDRENPADEPWPRKEEGDVPKCGLCASLEELGRQLPTATHIVITRLAQARAAEQHINDWREGLAGLGYRVDVIDAGNELLRLLKEGVFARAGRTTPQPDPSRDRKATCAFGDTPRAFAYRPLVNIVPWVGDEIATFDELCATATGIPRWGVLRMDVDNLGRLFSAGFREPKKAEGDVRKSRATLGRIASLSFGLRLFFEGALSRLAEPYNAASHPPPGGRPAADDLPGVRRGHDRVYAMYAGGDDLFIVGAWDALPHLAHTIRQEFGCFVAGNPTITLSGGISLADERFPIHQAAHQAGDAEQAAKDFVRAAGRDRKPVKMEVSTSLERPEATEETAVGKAETKQPAHDKDSLTFLGQAFGWEEFDAIWGRARQLQAWSDAGKINRSLIQTLRAIDNQYLVGLERQRQRRAQGKPGQAGQFYYGPWMWKLVYQLSRVAQTSDDPEVRAWVEKLRDELVEPDGPITKLGLIARWAEYLTRAKDHEEES